MPYSHREDFPLQSGADPKFYQPFTMAEWHQSTFVSSDRMDWFRDARYGMFIHFGLSTCKNKDLSWGICHTRKLPDVGHGPYPDEEWKSWSGLMPASGCKSPGLPGSATSSYTPFGRDVVREVVDACHAAGMPVGLYYSQRDWHHPDYMPVDPGKVTMKGVQWTLKPGFNSPVGARHPQYLAGIPGARYPGALHPLWQD